MFDNVVTKPDVRHDFVLLFDVMDGNPNGDPDAGNLPRLDPETMQGIVTDVCLKRKVRNYVEMVKKGEPGYEIYVKHRGILAKQQKRAFEANNLQPDVKPNEKARQWMCENFYDIRMFGAVMTMGKSGIKNKNNKELQWNCGQVRGPVQMTFARSIDPIIPLDISITRVALTNWDDVDRGSDSDEQAASGQMGRKSLVPYGLYLGYGFVNPTFGKYTGLKKDDLSLFWEALVNMWDIDRSAARGLMSCRGLYVFSHDNELGRAPAYKLFERITVMLNGGVTAPRKFADYSISVDEQDMPAGVILNSLVN